MNVSFNDESGINISSGGPLSVDASGGISISAESVSISAPSRVIAQCGGSYISLEGEIYNEANGVVAECGSDRGTYSPFMDDEPTTGAAAVKRKLLQKASNDGVSFSREISFKNKETQNKNYYNYGFEVGTKIGGSTASGTENKNGSAIENEFKKEPNDPVETLAIANLCLASVGVAVSIVDGVPGDEVPALTYWMNMEKVFSK